MTRGNQRLRILCSPIALPAAVLALVLMIFSISSSAESVTAPLSTDNQVSLNPYMYVLTDETNNLTIEQVSSPEFESRFIRNERELTHLGLTHFTHWIKVSLSFEANPVNATQEKHWYLEIAKSLIDVAELYVPTSDGSFQRLSSDIRKDWEQREFRHIYSVFPLTTRSDTEVTIYLKLQNSMMLLVPLTLWERDTYIEKSAMEEFLYGIFFGGMAMMIIYNLFVYISIRDTGYLYYVAYLSCISYFEILETGHGTIHVGALFNIVGKQEVPYVVLLALTFGGLFSRKFLELKTDHPALDVFALHLTGVAMASLFICFFMDLQTSIIWVTIYSSICLFFLLFAGVYIITKGKAHTRLFFGAWLFTALGFIIYSLMVNQVLPSNTLTVMAAPLSVLLEAVVFSFVLAHRIKLIQKEVLQADNLAMKSLQKYSSAYNNSPEGMYEMTLSGVIHNANNAMASIMGMRSISVIRAQSKSISLQLFSNPTEQFQTLMDIGEVSQKSRVTDFNGHRKWLHHRARLFRNESGRAIGIKGSVIDMTEEMEREISIHRGELERLERIVATEIATEKSHFLMMMSHEIRIPLTAIIGFSESLQRDNLAKDTKIEYVDIVSDHSRKLLKLINNILDLSKLDAEKFDIESIDMDLSGELSKINSHYTKRAKLKNLFFTMTFSSKIPSHIIGDPTRILQVLNNLCENAMLYTKKGGVKLSVSWRSNTLLFTIVDSGPGIPDQAASKLFTLVGNTGNVYSLNKGSGLGLPISQQFARLMGGDITYKKRTNNGSEFSFTINAKTSQNCSWLTRNSLQNTSSKPVIPSLQGVVLLAEDNPVNQQLIKKVLEKTGVTVIVANDGVAACDYCDREQPDLVLMDINMPNRNGIEATQYLRDNDHTMPILALTAETDKQETDKALAAGCQGVLSKPINKKETYQMLQHYLTAPKTQKH
ncbi:hypothetical protein A9Q99_01830 [Gammaproteobacteria bacterium 45_16_T64]|nr:hypothetical protein A9Q99_01830 [Gammaproteobacteria bacterium 45_16_T64]